MEKVAHNLSLSTQTTQLDTNLDRDTSPMGHGHIYHRFMVFDIHLSWWMVYSYYSFY